MNVDQLLKIVRLVALAAVAVRLLEGRPARVSLGPLRLELPGQDARWP